MNTQDSVGAFCVGGDGCRLAVEILGYENLEPQTVSDANWLRTRIRLEAGPCTIQIDAALTTQDIRRFLEGLDIVVAMLDGSASLEAEEQAISLRVEASRTGRARISGGLRELGAARVGVSFEFESDQSFLNETLSGLREVQRRYPVVDSV